MLAAVGLSFLLASKQRVQRGYFGQRLFPPKAAYDFSMTDQDGQACRLDQFRGKVAYYLFGFTHCPNVCPTSLTNLAAAYSKLSPAEQAKVRILFQSVDPARDTPAALKDYASFFGPEVIGLTGTKAEIDRTAAEYGASYEFVPIAKDPQQYTVNHSAYIYLIGATGQIEILYDNEQVANTDRLLGDLRKVLAE
jgi:protein SCO1/2